MSCTSKGLVPVSCLCSKLSHHLAHCMLRVSLRARSSKSHQGVLERDWVWLSESPAPSAHSAGVLEGIVRKEPTSVIPGSPGQEDKGTSLVAGSPGLHLSPADTNCEAVGNLWHLRTLAPSTVKWKMMALIPKHILMVSIEFW